MYVAVYPVFLTRQSSREQREVYGREDIAVLREDIEEGVLDASVWAQGKRLVARDSVYLFASTFLVLAVQGGDFTSDPANWTVFKVIFEIISAYGNVGLSLGNSCPSSNPNCTDAPPYSFSGTWSPLSKLLIVLVMLLGRHRGLPDDIDAALQLLRHMVPPVQAAHRPRHAAGSPPRAA
eukprot:TRINITY_DN14635_c0_g1_i3.p3 TRINITY_DN14635_c0_g1~~TRINITY_DN14635_c0_g1_i3.p3  ORF type:complete len:179 (+),score=2.32 TRINITY_DN14635_c0_g1_i3:815-1351(+)